MTLLRDAVDFQVVEGRGAASGRNEFVDLHGSLRAQKPLFKAAGIDLDSFFEGTINAELPIGGFEISAPLFRVRDLVWLDGHPGEDFDFCSCALQVHGLIYPGLIYYPRPETKHSYTRPVPPNLVEILAPFVAGLRYGTRGRLYVDPRQVKLVETDSRTGSLAAKGRGS